ncbi:tetratricopeptide repeat protein [Pediococcus pentosaceus]|uniref:Tetratricopeptide repeat protein n=1 Tax=Pediococcus pentosaceus TaxID=1255 RepID=A0AB73HFK1_PEDPE|nr:tetratricopeptide repeat protein [Pediococcus pentosaceus]KAF0468543.1 tetratricopeptide repeat protein [Pediococcus pentosaceus]MBF7115253.1 tetratricopeptide repeat protein [Pediococcus pentosaceus]MCM6792842.1 tetratricopeptide repeat protein [Pediococcus pentosaceus]MCM6810141.1 tetratricopeptide repeat protein [Pediococcus pentosaceus]MDN3207256.1 tetratricopeptide repeat protein [Pediococcus pentosaceus]
MDNNESYSQKTLAALESGQIEESNRLYSWALRKDDNETLYNLAGELFALGFDGKALRIYEKLIEEYPNDDELLVLAAEILIDQGKNDAALENLDQVSPDSEFYVSSLMVQADLYQTEELYEVSERKLVEAIKLAPEEPAIQLALGELYYTTQDYSKAVNYYLGLIKSGISEMSQINIVERLAASYAAYGKFEKAIAYFEQIHEEDLTPDILMQEGITYLQLDENERAQATLEKVIELDPSYSSAYPYLINSYQKDEQWDKGLIAAQEGLAVDQYNPELYLQAAEMAEHALDNELVEKYLRKAIELAPENTEGMIRITDFYNRIGKYDETLRFASDDITDAQLNWNLALAYWKTDDFKKAASHFDAALSDLKDTTAFLLDLYHFLRESGQLEHAVDIARKYVKLAPTDVDMQDELEQLEEQGY